MTPGLDFKHKEAGGLFTPIELPLKTKNFPPSKKKKVIVISGPTAVGKTELSLIIAQALGAEIISADSMQVYRGMDIGTAKASLKDRERIHHHLIDSRDLSEGFNVVEFYNEAVQGIREIFSMNRVPVVVGGTGFYIHALLYGPPSGPPSELHLRAKLENEMKENGAQALYERLTGLDPDYAATITQRDRHKIIRALEIISLTNQKVSDFSKAMQKGLEEFDFRCWFVYLPKEILYPRIEERCERMIAQGLVEEVRALEKEGLRKNANASKAIGYRQCLDYLSSAQGEEDWSRFVTAFKQASRRYAKRQFTWFRKEPLFHWMNLAHISLEAAAEMIIRDFEQNF